MRKLILCIRSITTLILALLVSSGGQLTATAATKAQCGAMYVYGMNMIHEAVRAGKIDKDGYEIMANDAKDGYRKCLKTGKYFGYQNR